MSSLQEQINKDVEERILLANDNSKKEKDNYTKGLEARAEAVHTALRVFEQALIDNKYRPVISMTATEKGNVFDFQVKPVEDIS